MQIDAIQQRAGNALSITLHLNRTATAFAFQVAKVATRARIHRGNEHELRGQSDAARSARPRNFSVFELLPHYFQRGSFEFRQLIEEENAVVGQAHFTRAWKRAAAKQTNVADGVMRGSEWSCRDEGLLGIEQAGDAVNFGRFNRFLE